MRPRPALRARLRRLRHVRATRRASAERRAAPRCPAWVDELARLAVGATLLASVLLMTGM